MKIILSKRFTLRLAAASVIALVPAGASLADPGLPDVRAHQHYLLTPNGDRMPIGPNVCDNPDLQDAFNQFHYNIHGSATVRQVGPDTMVVKGCAVIGLFCSEQRWTRVS